MATLTAKHAETKEGHVWYFAIASMMNPVSVRNRDLRPVQSKPAQIHGWSLQFGGRIGMATAFPDPDGTFHGVLHLMTAEDMKKLDAIEGGYDRVPARCTLYDGSELICTVYSYKDVEKLGKAMQEWRSVDNPPSERYIDICVRGCRHFGVVQSHIDWLLSLEVVPRKKHSEFKAYPVPSEPEIFTPSRLSTMTGVDGNRLCFTINGKVIEFKGSGEATKWFIRYAGKDATLKISHLLYEPLYPVSSTREEMSDEHAAWVEDFFYNPDSSMTVCVGLLVSEEDQKDSEKSAAHKDPAEKSGRI